MSETKFPLGFSPKHSRTGIPGVQLIVTRGKLVFVAKHGRRSRQFSVARFGREGAYRQALKVRALYEAKFGIRTSWSPETIERNRAGVTESWNDAGRREKASATARKLWRDPAVRIHRTAAITARMADPAVRARQLAGIRAHHARRKEAACR